MVQGAAELLFSSVSLYNHPTLFAAVVGAMRVLANHQRAGLF
ncbi:hypothetical protein HEK616_34540 [Streptomyces nigrescens]|uniref:Uncharacterized protein n=2 Tax=Streptomyces TaxID=1883 RepID=A0ABM7ZUH5_STRNI|nr:hypothetical protein [Streptomyces nigrescens]MEE4422445.1 hypothetical protein [Streptomyces sp. DSM 41528]BDM69967.1 hypothetical protein HEK616_34540 [Streptomyces nigrescens]